MDNIARPKKLGRYEIIRELGKGAMGVVYEGRDPSIGRRVAIKTARREVLERSGQAEELMERFLREARAAGALNHPNIITIYDVGEEGGIAYIAMEYVEGQDLNALIAQHHSLDVNKVVEWGIQICEALACAHDQGVFHRDVKPANIMMSYQGALKVADFGIARTHDSTLTQDGALIGTPSYMSPEQFIGKKVDARSDLFSLAIILYELLTGEKPFVGEALTTIMHHVLKSAPAPPHELNYLTPEALSAVIMKALSKKPQDRYGDCRLMAAALRESLKANPDMSIIQCTGAAMMETVMAAPGKISEPAPSTVTMPGAVPAGAQQATKLASGIAKPPESGPVESRDEAPRITADQASAGFLKKHLRLLAGGAAALCLVVGIALYFLAPAPVVVVGEVTSIGVQAFVTSDDTVNDALAEHKQQPDSSLIEWLDALEDAGVLRPLSASGYMAQARNPEAPTGVDAIYDKKELKQGLASLDIPQDAPQVRFEIVHNNAVVDGITIPAPQWRQAQTFILYEKPDTSPGNR
jgi:serine/threonine-protein kinase